MVGTRELTLRELAGAGLKVDLLKARGIDPNQKVNIPKMEHVPGLPGGHYDFHKKHFDEFVLHPQLAEQVRGLEVKHAAAADKTELIQDFQKLILEKQLTSPKEVLVLEHVWAHYLQKK